ncbi:MAG: sulfatase-like hydrolase/transferase, partial [Pseudomonadota bacterium]
MRSRLRLPAPIWCFASLLALIHVSGCGNKPHAAPTDPSGSSLKRANLLLIVADDMGFSDLGSFGGDADTPNLDSLALEGLRLTNFHAAPSCSPSRAQLLSGADNHLVGLGNMAELLPRYPWQQGRPGYEGYLTRKAVTLARVLQEHGYRTYMTGKWHMGHEPDLVPSARGFDRSFALMGGTSSHYAADNGRDGVPTIFMEDGQVSSWPADGYSSDVYTDKLLEFLDLDRTESKPFFAYLAYTAPHHPLHAPKALIDKYAGVFDDGYEAVMSERLARMRTLGVIPDREIDLFRHPGARSWSSLPQDEKA